MQSQRVPSIGSTFLTSKLKGDTKVAIQCYKTRYKNTTEFTCKFSSVINVTLVTEYFSRRSSNSSSESLSFLLVIEYSEPTAERNEDITKGKGLSIDSLHLLWSIESELRHCLSIRQQPV